MLKLSLACQTGINDDTKDTNLVLNLKACLPRFLQI